MQYFNLKRTTDPKIIGGRGESQIIGIDNGAITEVNKKLESLHQKEFLNISKQVFQVHYHAKITSVMTSILVSRMLLFVTSEFMKCFKGLNTTEYFLEPVRLVHRKQYLEKRFVFHPAMFDEGFINFGQTSFGVRNRETQEITPFEQSISSYNEYFVTMKDVWTNGGDLKPLSVKINENWDYDYAACRTFGLGHVVSERFVERLIENKITGIRYVPIQLDPFSTSGTYSTHS